MITPKLRSFKKKIGNWTFAAKDLPATASLRLLPSLFKFLAKTNKDDPEQENVIIGWFLKKLGEEEKRAKLAGVEMNPLSVLQNLNGMDALEILTTVSGAVEGDELTLWLMDFFHSCDLRVSDEENQDELVSENFDAVFTGSLKDMAIVIIWLSKELFTKA